MANKDNRAVRQEAKAANRAKVSDVILTSKGNRRDRAVKDNRAVKAADNRVAIAANLACNELSGAQRRRQIETTRP